MPDRLSEDALVTPPELPADKATLWNHYKEAQAIRACLPYEDVRWRCTWCLAVGRHVKDEGTRGEGRFCSTECRDGWAAHESHWENNSPLRQVVVVTEKQAKEREKVK